MRLETDRWVGNFRDFECIEDPTWDEVVSAIRRLDQHQYTELFLIRKEGHYFTVGGGSGQYQAFICIEEAFLNLCNPLASNDEEVRLVTGGQEGLFPGAMVVPLELVLAAGLEFYQSGTASSDVCWSTDE
jgi:hypothetical protein